MSAEGGTIYAGKNILPAEFDTLSAEQILPSAGDDTGYADKKILFADNHIMSAEQKILSAAKNIESATKNIESAAKITVKFWLLTKDFQLISLF